MAQSNTPGAAPGVTAEVYPAVKSILFDGVDEYMNANDAASSISFNDTAHTVSCWVKVPDTAGITYSVLWSFTRTTDAHTRYWLALNSSGVLIVFGWGDGSAFPVTAGGATCSSAIDDDAWHHVAMTYNGSDTLTCHIDGGSGTTVAVGAGALTPNIMSIGARRVSGSATTYPLAGAIADVSVFPRVVDASELARLSTAPVLDYGEMAPVFWSWMGDKDALTDIRDHGSNAGTVTLNNGVAGDLQDGAPS